MTLPAFRYHPDPIASGSVIVCDAKCLCCKKARGHIYVGPTYAEDELDDALCPWCIADGKAARKFDAVFIDADSIVGDIDETIIKELTTRTPGYAGWQQEAWPTCCEDACAFLKPSGIEEIRRENRDLEGFVLSHIIYNMNISGGAATRLVQSLNKDHGPTVYIFQCLKCQKHHFHIDQQ